MTSSVASQSALRWVREHAPTPTTTLEKLSLIAHAFLLHHGFRPSNTPPPPPVPTSLPEGWTSDNPGGHYRHSRSAMTFHIRLTSLGCRYLLHATTDQPDAPLHTVEISASKHLPPHHGQQQHFDWSHLRDLDTLSTIIFVEIAHKLVPDATKPGYEAATVSETTPTSSTQTPTPTPRPNPSPRLPSPSFMPTPLHPPHPPVLPLSDAHPFADDLLPPGLPDPRFLDPLRAPPRAPRAGMSPSGNLMGPASLLPARAPHGRLPRGVPPGARFDPFGPVGPDFDGLPPPAFDDEHGLRGPPGRPAPGGGGTGPPPFGSGAMYF